MSFDMLSINPFSLPQNVWQWIMAKLFLIVNYMNSIFQEHNTTLGKFLKELNHTVNSI